MKTMEQPDPETKSRIRRHVYLDVNAWNYVRRVMELLPRPPVAGLPAVT